MQRGPTPSTSLFAAVLPLACLALGCEETSPECVASIAEGDYAPCVRSCDDGNSSTCAFMSEYLGDRCELDDNLSACQLLCTRGESSQCDRAERILARRASADGPEPEPAPPTPATPGGPTGEARRLEEQLSVRTHQLLGRYRLAFPGEVALQSEDATGYKRHTYSELVEGRSVHLEIHEFPEGVSPGSVEGMASEAARLFALIQHGTIVLEVDRTIGESHTGRQLKFTTTSQSRGRTLHHDLLVFDNDNLRFYVHIATANRHLLDESVDYIAGSFAVVPR